MAEIIMPKMGDAMTEGKLLRWYKKAGDTVKKGEAVAEIETDKVNLDLEAEDDGTIGELAAEEGQMVPVGGVLATLLGPGEKAEPVQRRKTDKKDSIKHSTGEYGEAMEMKGPRVDRTANVVPMPQGDSGRQRSSPLARKVARELGVSLDQVQGSGPKGRIIAADVKNVGRASARPTPAIALESKSIPLTAMRRTIAKRLAESIGPIPHFFLTVDYDVTNLLALREQINEVEGVKTSLNDYVVRAAALALRHHPNVNASFGDEAIAQHGEIHIGIAVSTPEGLITPVVRNADQKSIVEISNEVRALADKAKNRKLKPDEYQGSTFTISNLGAWGIEEFTAIINPPNVGILAVGAAMAQAVVVDKQVVVRDRMKITMSCDHRVVDGVAGAEYLRTLRQYIEQPVRLIL
ncbi:MAG: dihydrolipoamide acetyltransferase family protein [Acidobacteriota bacterium]